MSEVVLDSAVIHQKLAKISSTWSRVYQEKENAQASAPDGLIVVMGKVREDPLRIQSVDFFIWLLGYEFSDTIVLLTREKAIFAVSPKKKALLEAMKRPENYDGPAIQVVLKDTKLEPEQLNGFINTLLTDNLPGKNVAIYQKNEELDGPLSEALMGCLKSKQFKLSEMKDFMNHVNKVKIPAEIQNIRTAASFVEWSCKKMITEVEKCLENDIKVRHSKISNTIERLLDNPDKIGGWLQSHGITDAQLLEYPLPVLLQSGSHQQGSLSSNITLNKFGVESDQKHLDASIIYISICAKYIDMHAMASRMLLINPTKEQKQTYSIAYEVMQHLKDNAKVGTVLSDLYNSTKSFIRQKDADLAQCISSNFGFGIGSGYKEDILAINATNSNVIEPGMVFHLRVTFKECQTGALKNTTAAIGDTILIQSDEGSRANLTGNVPSKFNAITYTLDDDEEEEEKENERATQRNGQSQSRDANGARRSQNELDSSEMHDKSTAEVMLNNRTRLGQKEKEKHQRMMVENQLKQSQAALLDKKLEELRKRYEDGDIAFGSKKQKVKDMGRIQSYSSIKKLPHGLKRGSLYVDEENHTILVPINNEQFVPFHISTINNVSKSSEGQWTYLRINFHTPSVGKSGVLQFPDHEDPNAIFVKELTLKNQDLKGESNHLNKAEKNIKELIKRAKVQDQEEEDRKENEANAVQAQQLKTLMGRRDALENVIIKPNLEGRKTIGNLELHQNGLRYVSTKGFKVDIPFAHVKHAFFQPCAQDELVAIIHFTLKRPLTLSNKKVFEVQFFKESGVAADDIDMRGGRRRMNDLDELELEERERQAKKKLSDRFHQFARIVENQSRKCPQPIEFDVPINDLWFMGCPMKSAVKIRPTSKNCLIAITEFPFFVIDVRDIEAVHFERVAFGIKNFDMAIIFKDFHTFKRINSIPRESIEEVKTYLDSVGIVFSEGVVPMNWNMVLTKIRQDFEGFLEKEGGWKFLHEDANEEEEGEEGSELEDPEFVDDGGDSSSEDEESDYSDDDDDDDSGGDYGDSDEESEGLSWEEMEKRAYEEDRKAAQRRQQNNQQNQNAGRNRRRK